MSLSAHLRTTLPCPWHPHSLPSDTLPSAPSPGLCRAKSIMARRVSREDTYLYDLPYGVTREIVQSLDADKSWEDLASALGYSFEQIKRLELEYGRYNGSPSKSLLWEWGCKNATVKDLHNKLDQLNRIREMHILDKYINSDNERQRNADGARKTGPVAEQVQPVAAINTSGLPSPPSPPLKKTEDNKVNFNQVPFASKTSGKQPTSLSLTEKHYDDKVMPGNQPQEKKGPQAVEMEDSSMLRSSQREPQESTISTSTISISHSSSNVPSSVVTSSSSSWATSQAFSDSTDPAMKSMMDVAMALLGTSSYAYEELCKATGNFHESQKLGEGAFGVVYLGNFRGNKCAIKKLQEHSKVEEREKRTGQLKCELTALLKYRHENIVTLYGYALDGPSLCLVYQYMVNGSLEDRLHCREGSPPLTWEQRINIALGSARGLHFLHTMGEKPLIHGDVKSANILLDRYMEAKIGDLGQAQHANSGASTGRFTHITKKDMNSKIYGTRAYFPPELLRGGESMSTKTDIFSFGVVMLEICTGEKAYEEKREPHKFLASHFEEKAEEMEERHWPDLCDKKAGPSVDSILIKTLKVAIQCVNEKKKKRPDTAHVVAQLDEINEKIRRIELPSSFHPLSLHSGENYSGGNLTANIPSSSPSSPPPPLFSPTDPYRAKPLTKDMQQAFGRPMEGQSSGVSPPVLPVSPGVGNAVDLLPAGFPVPLSIIMQQEYDRRNKAASPEAANAETFQSDPEKLAQILRHDQQLRLKHSEASVPPSGKPGHCSVSPVTKPPGAEVEEPELRSDPDKLHALKQFDTQNPMCKERKTSEAEACDPRFRSPPSDPKKLQRLMIFDAGNTESPSSPGPTVSNSTDEAGGKDGAKISNDETVPKDDFVSSSTDFSEGSHQQLPEESCERNPREAVEEGAGCLGDSPMAGKDFMKQKMMNLFSRYEKIKAEEDEENLEETEQQKEA